MHNGILQWLRERYAKISNSIAFYPALIAIGFLLLSWLMLQFDFSETGKQIKAAWVWLRLKDANTARVITSTIAAGILSFTVFSFSMVMIVMNQAASQMSNRVLESLIGNRLQQVILGFYIGTIVYALFLLSSIRDIDAGVHIPALSVYLLMTLTIADIFLFIYFLHYVTQSVKYETIIHRVHKQTLKSMQEANKGTAITNDTVVYNHEIEAPVAGYFQGFDTTRVLRFAQERNIRIKFLHPAGAFVLKGVPMLRTSGDKPLKKEAIANLFSNIDFYNGQPVDRNYTYGLRHLTEVAVKALSPGINDPATAVLSLHALSELLAWRLQHPLSPFLTNEAGVVRIETGEPDFAGLFAAAIYPVWDYGKKDRSIQAALQAMLDQLLLLDGEKEHAAVLNKLAHEVKQKISETV